MKHLLLTTIAAVVLVGCGNPEADRALLDAAVSGDIEAAKKAIVAGADVSAEDDSQYGDTPLHKAASSGHKEVAALLIVEGADVNSKEQFGMTPLHHASRNGHKEIVELLIAAGADVDAKRVAEGLLCLMRLEKATKKSSNCLSPKARM